ncbi:unnamed protein product [Caenorhabditis auriculariae]|uniref:Magnesium transporter NIPA2 n=1 Tax=Caenorhabditis auriculariae TaxID=2777116 RepID=A0A8S1GQD9_9PELO|nr:unnamed protein product [Caenorhabditis auriculariae]
MDVRPVAVVGAFDLPSNSTRMSNDVLTAASSSVNSVGFPPLMDSSDRISSLSADTLDRHFASTDFYIGLGLAVSSSLFIGSSFIIKKKALLKLAGGDLSQRASEGGYGYLREWLWWMGVITMGVGEACNFAAYAFAPASLVTPLGALSVIVTAILSSRLLNERLNILGSLGCALCLLGSTVIVIHSPKEEEVGSMAELALKMQDAGFLIYVILILLTTGFIVVYVAPAYGRTNILVYISVCSLIGSLSVLSVKGLGLAIKETLGGNQQFTNWLTYFWLICVASCVSVQLVYLNKALDVFNTSMVTPIYYVFFTTFVILASSILYKEWSCLGASDVLGNLVGFLTTIIGIFQMQLFRDVNITLHQVHRLVGRPSACLASAEFNSSSNLVDDFCMRTSSNSRRTVYT